MKKPLFKRIINALIIISLLVVTSSFGNQANAAVITSLSDNLSRLKASTAANHTIHFVTPSGVAAAGTITVTFSADFTGVSAIVFGDVDFAIGDSNNCTTAGFTEQTLADTPVTTTWGAASAGQVTTITSGTGTVTADRCVRIEIGTHATTGVTGTNQISNGAVDDDDTVTIGGTLGDAGVLAVDIITDDQVTVAATVNPTITFAISDSTIGFGTLLSGSARYATSTTGSGTPSVAHTVAASTNGASGFTVYVLGATLTSAGNTITAIGGTAATSSPGSEQFGLYVVAAGGSGTATAPYQTAANYAYDAVSAQDEIGASTVASATTTYSVYYMANIAAVTEAGAYTTTLTYTATAGF